MSRIDAIYARQSIDKADSISIDSQIEFCTYETHGNPFEVYCDKGYSGKNTERPQFQALLSAVNNGKIKRVICYKLDRCSRSILDFTQLMELFQKNDVEFISCTEKFDTSTPMGRAMLNICIVFAQLERETIQQRIYDAYHSRSKLGYYMGGRVPFGFQLVPHQINGKKTATYRPVESEVSILNLMYEVYQKPATSLSDVVATLKLAGIQNPKRDDGIWVRSHISRILKNPIYVKADGRIYHYFAGQGAIMQNALHDYIGHNGCYLFHKDNTTHLVLAPHEGIIDSEVWLRCNKKGQNTENSKRKQKAINSWLIGKMKCEKCGYAAVIRKNESHNGKIYRYIVCSKSFGLDCICSGFSPLNALQVEELIGSKIHSVVNTIQQSICQSTHIPEKGQSQEAILQLQQEIRHLLRKAAQVSDITAAYIDEEIRERNTKIKHLRACIANEIQTDNHACKILSTIPQFWSNYSISRKMAIADILIDSIQLGNNRLRILWSV